MDEDHAPPRSRRGGCRGRRPARLPAPLPVLVARHAGDDRHAGEMLAPPIRPFAAPPNCRAAGRSGSSASMLDRVEQAARIGHFRQRAVEVAALASALQNSRSAMARLELGRRMPSRAWAPASKSASTPSGRGTGGAWSEARRLERDRDRCVEWLPAEFTQDVIALARVAAGAERPGDVVGRPVGAVGAAVDLDHQAFEAVPSSARPTMRASGLAAALPAASRRRLRVTWSAMILSYRGGKRSSNRSRSSRGSFQPVTVPGSAMAPSAQHHPAISSVVDELVRPARSRTRSKYRRARP